MSLEGLRTGVLNSGAVKCGVCLYITNIVNSELTEGKFYSFQ